MEGRRRVVEQRGALTHEVAHDEVHPVLVHAAEQIAVVGERHRRLLTARGPMSRVVSQRLTLHRQEDVGERQKLRRGPGCSAVTAALDLGTASGGRGLTTSLAATLADIQRCH